MRFPRAETVRDCMREAEHVGQMALRAVAEANNGHPENWSHALGEVMLWQRYVASLRSVVRRGATTHKRATCCHPQTRRFTWAEGSSECQACGQKFRALYPKGKAAPQQAPEAPTDRGEIATE